MKAPHEVLDLPANAYSDQVRQRYLELVKVNSPERAPERFAEIRAAYEAMRDPVARVERLLFDTVNRATLRDISERLRTDVRDRPVATEMLLSFGRK